MKLIKNNNKLSLLKIIPLMIIIVGGLFYFLYGKDITVVSIVGYSPEGKFLSILYMLVLFIVKSLTVVFPVSIIFIISGMIFSPLVAIIINIVGISIGFTISYYVGYFSKGNKKQQLISKYPKLNEVESLLMNNQWIFIFLLRTVGIVPVDVVSIFMGAVGVNFKSYMIASVLGMIPIIVPTTFIGTTFTNPTSLEFILSLITRILISIISILIYKETVDRTVKNSK